MKYDKLKSNFETAQGTEEDLRDHAKECALFVEKRDGQWEPEIVQKFHGKPRYTDDRVSPLINQIAGEMSEADFTVRVKPAGGDATKEIARIYDGIIRSIRNQSNAENTFKAATRNMLKSGVAGWEIVQDYADADTFDQELIIKPLFNYEQRVWVDPYSLEQDNRDAKWAVVLEYVSKDEYERRFPDGQMLSLGNAEISEAYSHKPEYITIARAYYRKPVKREIVEMSNGRVYEVDDDFKAVADELAQAGITENRRRVRDSWKVYTRMFDGGGYLTEEEETVFNYLPIVTVYGNYSVSEGKRLYHGVVEKLLDIQRVHNYAFSREIEEVALAPRAKFWMTRKQVSKNKQDIEDLQSLNTNPKPVQFYEVDPEAPPPAQQGGAQVNPALRTLVGETAFGINHAAGIFSANLGDNPGLQSGTAIEKQINQGNNGSKGYFDSMACAIEWTGRILVDAIPKVYDSTRQVRILGEDGSQEMLTLNQTIIDQQTGQPITLNDLSQGNYDVVCDMGAAYKNRMDQAVEMFIRASERDPAAMEMGRDILYKNINAPGFDDLAQRARAMMLEQGLIPMEQLTQEEQAWMQEQQAQAQQQDPQQDPNLVLAQAEMLKGQADMMAQQNKQAEIQLKAADVQAKYQGQADKLQSETALNMAKVQQGEQSLLLQAEQQQTKAQLDMMKLMLEQQKAQADEINKLAGALNSIKSAIGADAIMSQSAVQAYESVARDIVDESGS